VSERLQEIGVEFANLKFRVSELGTTIPSEKAEILETSISLLSDNIHAASSANEGVKNALSPDSE